MKCVKIVGKKELEINEIEEPKSENGSVIIKVSGCGICGSDIHNWWVGEPLGLIMGHEFCGTVTDPGDCKDLKIGERVTALPISPCDECESCKSGNPQFCTNTWLDAVGLSLSNPGAYAEYTSVRSDMVRVIPDSMSDDEACMIEPTAVSLHAVNLANIHVGEKVLIVGGGIIGLMCAELAKKNGATKVVLLETNEKRAQKALSFGYVDEYYNSNDENLPDSLKELTAGGFDKIFECCGSEEAITRTISLARAGASIILVGVPIEDVSLPLMLCVIRGLKLQGSIAYNEKEFDDTIKLITNRIVDVNKYIDDHISLEEVQDTFENMDSGNDNKIKIIIKP